MKNIKVLFLLTFIPYFISAQMGIRYNSLNATDGFTLLSNGIGTALINNCGKVVKKWDITFPENHCKILPDGKILYSKNNAIHEVNWEDDKVIEIPVKTDNFYLDYEIIKLKNGNYLCLGREEVSLSTLQSHGYNYSNTTPEVSDIVIEVNPKGEVVWRWNLLDHVIQDKFPSKKSYGVLKDHPEKLNINAIATYDWNNTETFMINGMDYNEELDQIVLSVRKLSEIAIIDHSTTTAEAKTSSGGKYNKGGDILYRYGNPANYNRGSASDQQLYFQHNPNWIQYGPDKGKIIIFNNLLSSKTYSRVEIIQPPLKPDGSYEITDDKPFQPLKPEKEFGTKAGQEKIYSRYTSGAKVLPNGNIAITEGQSNRLLEIDPDGVKVWEYFVPNSSYIFRAERYASDYQAFNDKNMSASGTLEFPSSSYACMLFPSETLEEDMHQKIFITFMNEDKIYLNLEKGTYRIFDLRGVEIQNGVIENGMIDLNFQKRFNIYFLNIETNNKISTLKFLY